MSTDVTIIIVTYNSAHIIGGTLDNLPAGYPTIIIDNASEDDTCEQIQSHSRPDVTLIRHDKNSGYGTANNIGMKKCKTRYVLILNPDAEITTAAIETLKTALQSHPTAVLAAPLLNHETTHKLQPHPLFHPNNPLFRPFLRREKKRISVTDFTQTYECGFLSGACLLYDLQKMPEPLYFDEDLFMYYDESEWQSRIIKNGYTLLFVPQATAKHVGMDSTRYESSTEKIRVHYYHTGRSRGVLAAKYPDRINKRDMHAFISRTSVLAKLTRILGMRDKATKYAARLEGFKSGYDFINR